MTLLIIGASGFLGRHVARQALALGMPTVGTYANRPLDIPGLAWRRLDIADRDAVTALVDEVRPTAVVSAALSPAPLIPTGLAVSWSTNAVGAVNVALATKSAGVRLVHVSSDAVHTGRPEPIDDAEPPSPTYPYGAAKAAAELTIATIYPDAALCRVSLINSDGTVPDDRDEPDPNGALSIRERFMLDLADGRKTGILFTDDIRRPIAVTDLASALLELALGVDGGGTAESAAYAGLLNLAGADDASFYDLGVLVARRHGLDPARLRPASIAESGIARPGVVRLDSSVAGKLLRTRLRGIRELLG